MVLIKMMLIDALIFVWSNRHIVWVPHQHRMYVLETVEYMQAHERTMQNYTTNQYVLHVATDASVISSYILTL